MTALEIEIFSFTLKYCQSLSSLIAEVWKFTAPLHHAMSQILKMPYDLDIWLHIFGTDKVENTFVRERIKTKLLRRLGGSVG